MWERGLLPGNTHFFHFFIPTPLPASRYYAIQGLPSNRNKTHLNSTWNLFLFFFLFLKSVWFEFKRDMDFPARSRLIQEDVWGRKTERKRRDWFLSRYLLFHLCWKELLHFCSFKNAGFRFIRLKKKKKVDGISGNELLYDLSPNLI